MNNKDKIYKIIDKSSEYILSNLFCKEHKVFHRGRNSYLWTILLYLYKKNKDPKIISKANYSLNSYKNCFGINKNNDLILLPGLNVRGNYSTNAIDCGIFLDSINDLKEIIQLPNDIEVNFKKIMRNYAYKKLKNRSLIHNQYLWLLTGFSRCIKGNFKRYNDKYLKLVIEIVNSFYSENLPDGSCPYNNLSDDLNQITTYYHSRCLAFASYSLDNISYRNNELESKFYKGALFLAKMYKPDGLKSLSLETKRYYFHNQYEVGSFPYDIYVFEKAFSISGDNFWLYLSQKCIDKIYQTINNDGSQESKLNQKFSDWQCNIMRNTHHAWLTRISNQFLDKMDNYKKVKTINKENILNLKFVKSINEIESSLLLINNEITYYQFLQRKSPISNLYGQRIVGIQPDKHLPISNLFLSFPYEYRRLSFKAFNLKYFIKDLSSIKGALLQIKDTLSRRNIKKAFYIFNDHILSYFLVGSTTLSSSFPLSINDINISDSWIGHNLQYADIKGFNILDIGYRKIILNSNSLFISDILYKNKISYTFLDKDIEYILNTKYKLLFKFFNKKLLILFGPFMITYKKNIKDFKEI